MSDLTAVRHDRRTAVRNRTRLAAGLRGLAAASAETPAPAWAAERELVTVRSRLADRLVETVELSPEHLPPGEAPDLGGHVVTVPGRGVASAPLAVRVAFAGASWLCLHAGTEWERNAVDPMPSLVYEVQPAGA